MPSYLAQIASSVSRPAGPRLRPFIRSQSPIAENDQRIGLSEDFLSAPVGDQAPVPMAEATLESANPPPAVTSQPATPPSVETPRSAPQVPSARLVQLRAIESPPATGVVGPRPTSPEPLVQSPAVAASSRAVLAPQTHSDPPTAQTARAPRQRGEVIASVEAPPATRRRISRQTGPAKPEPEGSAPRVSRITEVRSADEAVPEPVAQVAETASRAAAEVPPETERHQPVPHAPRPPQPALPPEVEISPSGPRVVIDRLEIEVVPPPAPVKPEQASERTAPSSRPRRPVSEIGPLTQSTASRHYLALRYR
jgi:hypothetical protein